MIMDSLGYTLVIAALLLLACLMLYARFAGRAIGKSLHHAPVQGSWPAAEVSDAPSALPLSPGSESDGRREEGISVPKVFEDGPPVVRLDPLALDGAESSGGDQSLKKAYLDELQEAAAGLAMLMRSSPAARTSPVLFDPSSEETVDGGEALGLGVSVEGLELLEAVAEEACEDLALVSEVESTDEAELAESSEEFLAGVEGETPEFFVGGEVLDAEMEAFDASPELSELREVEAVATLPQEPEASAPRSLGELLGEQVEARFSLIDGGLDELEDLVSGIESSLRLLRDPIEELGISRDDGGQPEEVCEAA
jgi:hypothetical protein